MLRYTSEFIFLLNIKTNDFFTHHATSSDIYKDSHEYYLSSWLFSYHPL